MDYPSNMEINNVGIKKKPTISGLTIFQNYHLMVDLETIIALASMQYNVDLGACELHMGDKKIFNDFLNEC